LSLAPVAKQTFTLKDFSFEMPDVLPAGSETYKVVNVGYQPHELNVLKLTPGTTAQDVLSWDQAPAGPPPFESVVESTPSAPPARRLFAAGLLRPASAAWRRGRRHNHQLQDDAWRAHAQRHPVGHRAGARQSVGRIRWRRSDHLHRRA